MASVFCVTFSILRPRSPLFQSAFIYDNAASIKGKGIDFAMDRLNCHLQRHFRKHGLKGGILVFDFTNYFGDAQHWTVQEELAWRVHDFRTRDLANTFLENFGPVGYGLGSQISQQAALMLPNLLDHVIKQELGIKGYGRYMDDGYLIHEDMGYLKKCLARIKEVCAKLGIRLNERKTKIRPITRGIVFLKTKFILTETGRVLRKMSRAAMRAMKRKLFKFRNDGQSTGDDQPGDDGQATDGNQSDNGGQATDNNQSADAGQPADDAQAAENGQPDDGGDSGDNGAPAGNDQEPNEDPR